VATRDLISDVVIDAVSVGICAAAGVGELAVLDVQR
jgi:hypothetical protein